MSFRKAVSANSGTAVASSVTVSLSGAVAGDAAVIMVGYSFTTPTLTTPTGWTLLAGPSDVGTGLRTYLFGKVLTSADITAGSVTFTASATGRISAAGAIISNPAASPFGTPVVSTTTTTTTGTVATVTTTAANSVVVEFAFDTISSGTPATMTFPNGTTDAQTSTSVASGTNTSAAVGHINATTPGSYGGGTVTKDSSFSSYAIEVLAAVTANAVMNAGPDQTNIEPETVVTLDSSASTGVTSGRTWTQTAGPTVTLSSTTATSPTFTAPPVLNDTTFTFKVTDNASGASDTVNIGVLRSSRRIKLGGVMTPVYRRITLP